MNKLYALLALAVTFVVAGPAFAAEAASTDIQIIPAEWFQTGTLAAFATAVGGAVYALIEKFMGPFGWAAKVARLDQMIVKYLQGGLVRLVEQYPELATRGITVSVGNAFVAAIARDVLRVAPGWLVRFAGGAAAIEEKIRNRLPEVLRDLKLPSLPVAN